MIMNKNGLIHGEEYKPMPPIGSLRIGEKYIAQNGNESVRSIDYFRATGDYARFFHDVYGEKPNRIKIIFPSSDARLSCCNYYEIRKGSMLYAVGDGVFFMYANKEGKLEEKIIKEDFETSQFKRESEDICTTPKLKAEWKKRLRLRFFIEGIRGITGYWELITGAERHQYIILSIRFTLPRQLRVAGYMD